MPVARNVWQQVVAGRLASFALRLIILRTSWRLIAEVVSSNPPQVGDDFGPSGVNADRVPRGDKRGAASRGLDEEAL